MSLRTRVQARYHYWLGLAQRSRGNSSSAQERYEDAIGELTIAIEINPSLAEAHFVRGVIYWRELNDGERAVRDFTRAVELKPQLAGAYLNRGLARVYRHVGTRAEAIADFERYLALGGSGYWRMEAQNQIASLKDAGHE